MSTRTRLAPRRLLGALSAWLPRGRTLSDTAWELRHAAMLRLLAGSAAGLLVFGVVEGYSPTHVLVESLGVLAFGLVGLCGPAGRAGRSGAVALGLLSACAVLVHLSGGVTEAHFAFFVMIAALTLYEDWVPFLLAVAFVLVHHAVGSLLLDGAIYSHTETSDDGWKWAVVHAGFVAAACVANVVGWRLHEGTRSGLRRLAKIVESSDDAIVSVSCDGVVSSWNDGARRLFGWDADEIVGRPLDLLTPPDLADDAASVFARVRTGTGVRAHDTDRLTKDGRRIAVRLSASPLRDAGGAVAGVSMILHDETARRHADEALHRERRRLTRAEAIGQIGNWEWDPRTDDTVWSRNLRRIFGVDDATEPPRDVIVAHVHPEDRARVRHHLARAASVGVFEPLEYRIVRGDGAVRHVAARGEAERGEDGRVARILGVVADVTERRLAEDAIRDSQEALAHQALHDALTGLPNRTLLRDRLSRALQRTRRGDSCVAVLFFDVDRFKVVNDSLGHAAGDELLVRIAARVDEVLRPTDTLARFGGDEFAVVGEDIVDERDAIALAERILEVLARPFPLVGGEYFATASIGVALSDAASTTETLLRDADAAMYRAKERRAGYELFDADMRRRSLERMRTENELRRALQRDELVLHYQPVVSLEDGSTTGAEALVRWAHPERGLLSPGHFVPLAEECGLIVPLGTWVLEAACRQLASWADDLPERFSLAVNVSARQFADPRLVETVRAALESADADPRRLTLELTESVLMQHEHAQATLEQLRDLGVRVMMDDFGTGYSSLSYLSRFPLDGLKIDQSFVARMVDGSAEHAIIAAVGSMADALQLDVVAEGVETEDQRDALGVLGYRRAQGYLFARPMPPEDFHAALAADGARAGSVQPVRRATGRCGWRPGQP